MQIPETPKDVQELDLMKRLLDFAEGKATWDPSRTIGTDTQAACRTLYTNITDLVNKVLSHLLDRISAREMDTFTMHDRSHGLKVAHLMWYILDDSRREALTPPEIGILVLSAHIHDIGMALSKEERERRLAPTSDIWDRLEIQESTKSRMETLREKIGNKDESISRRARIELDQAEEALLCQDTRERHATRERYGEILGLLRDLHQQAPASIPSPDTCLSFGGDSFQNQIIDVCVSHNEDAESLVRRDSENPERPRFPTNFPVGSCTADLQMAAAALRLADILDFDRERTPPALFYYLIPGPLSPTDNRSVIEWGKHMAISNWQIDKDAVVFRGRCRNHIIHHAIAQFCLAIQDEIAATRATFGAMQEELVWPFHLPAVVEADIHEEGYHYVPYRFELDDQRVYELLMGGAIYDNPLVAVRELVQNAVDACKLRDALIQLYEPYAPANVDRIIVRYEEPNERHSEPVLTVQDSGTGMDAFILERYFLKVGRSYYRSVEFHRERIELRKKNLDFAAVSEFGIGFLSCFLLSDRVEVESAMSESPRGDLRKRTLIIDGPTRLIRLSDTSNEGPKRFKGTRISLHLCREGRGSKTAPPSSDEVRAYLKDVCQDLPYRLTLEHVTDGGTSSEWIDPIPMKVQVPAHLESAVLRIPVRDTEFGLEGEIVLTNLPMATRADHKLFEQKRTSFVESDPLLVEQHRSRRFYPRNPYAELFRGGFKVGLIPGLPETYIENILARARLRLTWHSRSDRRYPSPNLARNRSSDESALSQSVARVWLTYLLEHCDELPEGQLSNVSLYSVRLGQSRWLERFDAYTLYRLAARGWGYNVKGTQGPKRIQAWENGEVDRMAQGREWHQLFGTLLDLVLPRISSLIAGPEGNLYVSRPVPEWRDVLTRCRDFVTHPIEWGSFVEFTAPINKLLYYDYPGYSFFNFHFRDRLKNLNAEQLQLLLGGLHELVESTVNKRPAILKHEEADAVRRAIIELGDLRIGSMHETWQLDSFIVP